MTKREEPYRHGGLGRHVFSRLNIPERSVVDFSVNLNPLGPPPVLRERWGELFRTIEPYPTVNGEGVGRYYEKRYGLAPEEFLPGNGSTEMIYLLPRALGLRRVVVITPSYHDYTRASLLAGATVRHCPLRQEEASFSLPVDELAGSMRDAEALWLGNPNNPTGSLFPREVLLELSRRFPDKWIIVDEAFMPFVGEAERLSLMTSRRPQNVLVLHSLTKFFAIAGIRIGGLAGSRDVIGKVKALKEPWTVNGLAEGIAPLLLECREYEEETLSLVQREKDRLFRMLRNTSGLVCLRPAANFILCQWRPAQELDNLIRDLLLEGIYVRDCRNFPGLEENWFRVGVRLPEENDRLVHALTSLSLGNHG